MDPEEELDEEQRSEDMPLPPLPSPFLSEHAGMLPRVQAIQPRGPSRGGPGYNAGMRREPPYATDLETLEREAEVEFFRASGPGGQHRNKVETGVRLRHPPSGLVVTATERRSQSLNRRLALERLQGKLRAMNRPRKKRVPTRPTAASLARRREEKQAASGKKRERRKPAAVRDDGEG